MNKKSIIEKSAIVLLFLIFVATSAFLIKRKPINVDKDFTKINLDDAKKVMFVAHPDDDSIWGGAHLLEDGKDYLVVCITCGEREDRVKEFISAMERVESQYIMLGYPDKTNGKKDDWQTSIEKIHADIDEILQLKTWDMIVTHNPEGEYGHIHHKMTSSAVTELADVSKLMYFAKYYKPSLIDDYKADLKELSDELYQKKYDLIGVYKTQDFVYDMFGHMFRYENWIKYEDWNNE